MKKERILSVIAIATTFGSLPSEVMHIKDEYTAFCFDEACTYITNMMRGEDQKTPRFEEDEDVVRRNTTLEMMMNGTL